MRAVFLVVAMAAALIARSSLRSPNRGSLMIEASWWTNCGMGRSLLHHSSLAAAAGLPRVGPLAAAAAATNRLAVVNVDGSTHTYADLLRDTHGLQQMLLQTKKHDFSGRQIALLIPREYHFAVGLCGIWAAGATAVPLCTSHPPLELEHVLQDSQTDTVLFHPRFNATVAELKPKLPGVRHWITSEDFQRSMIQATDIPLVDTDMDAGALIIYTSGTTGRPKGAWTTHANVSAMVDTLRSAWQWSNTDRVLHILPLHHVHGLVNVLLCALSSGATCEFTTDAKFSPSDIWQRWMSPQKNLTLFMAVPTIYSKLIDHFSKMSREDQARARHACSHFRLMVSGSSPLPKTIFKKWVKISGHRLLERYGMTEIGMALGNPIQGPRVPGEVGVPFPDVQVRIQADSGEDVTDRPNEPGQLLVRGPQVFREYYGRKGATQEAFLEPGHWFLTGDIASRTEHGTFRILGRASVDIIKTSGYKVSALEIEREILDHPDVAEVSVIGIDSSDGGQSIAAIVVPHLVHDGAHATTRPAITLNSLREWLASRLASYKLPRRLFVVNDIPKNAMGKVNKKELAKQFC